MSISSKQRRKLQHFIKELEPVRGRHTELVTVYIPAGYDLNKIIGHLSQEQGTATNIKDSTTRKNVIDSLERMIQHLRLYKKTPDNGLAVFSGNIAERAGQQDIGVWSLEPPEPLNFRLYRCDKVFQLDALKELANKKELYGMIVMDRRDAHIALLRGKSIEVLTKTHSTVAGKTRAGGQSAQRFERLREGAAKDFYNRVADYTKKDYMPILQEIKGVLVGGPGQTKYDWVDGGYLTDLIKRKIITIQDLSYTGPFGLQELLEKCQDVLANEEVTQEKKIMQKFFERLSKNSMSVSYGEEQVKKCLNMGAIDTLLLSEALDEDVIEQYEADAENFGTTVEVISTETREGAQLRDLGKFAALLRFDVE